MGLTLVGDMMVGERGLRSSGGTFGDEDDAPFLDTTGDAEPNRSNGWKISNHIMGH